MPFNKLGLIEPLLQAVRTEGYTVPTAIQQQAILPILEGRDLLGCAQTGTGKTAAFALPILQHLHRRVAADKSGHRPIRALIVAPTRELAAQIGESFRAYGRHAGLRHAVVFGGVKQGPQEKALRAGVDILVATPGRLLDLLNQRIFTLRQVEILVLDEADRMLDMGFINDIRRIIAQVPTQRQTLLFSATMPREIYDLAATLMKNPVKVRVTPDAPAAETVEHGVYFVDETQKSALLDHVLRAPEVTRALVFTRTKHRADRVVRRLAGAGISAEAIHSNKSQNARMRALDGFKTGRTRVLVASDIASRGLDVDNISHVINYDLPADAGTYVHRIGRTGRAGAAGRAVSFCSGEQRGELRDIQRLMGQEIPVLTAGIKLAASPEMHGTAGQRHGGARGRPQGSSGHRSGYGSHKPVHPQKSRDNFWRRKQGSRRSAGHSSNA